MECLRVQRLRFCRPAFHRLPTVALGIVFDSRTEQTDTPTPMVESDEYLVIDCTGSPNLLTNLRTESRVAELIGKRLIPAE